MKKGIIWSIVLDTEVGWRRNKTDLDLAFQDIIKDYIRMIYITEIYLGKSEDKIHL